MYLSSDHITASSGRLLSFVNSRGGNFSSRGAVKLRVRRLLFPTLAGMQLLSARTALPTEWTDADTGHRVIRLSREDGAQSLYFNQNAYTADGKKPIVTTAGGGIATITLATREVRPLAAGPVSVLVAGRKTGDVYYIKRLPGGRNSTAGQSAAWRECAFWPAQLRSCRRRRQTHDMRGCQGPAAARLVDGHARRCLARPVHGKYEDGGSEGYPAGARVAGSSAVFAGHEFFSADGAMIWYDLQTPRGQDFWPAGCQVAAGKRTWYHLERNQWPAHFNVSPDGTLFAGDGGDSEMAARAPDGKWIYLFRPERVPDVAGIKAANSDNLIDTGFFKAERLVNMSKHDYRLEPDVTFSPDMKWVVFRSNMLGPVHVYAVAIAKSAK